MNSSIPAALRAQLSVSVGNGWPHMCTGTINSSQLATTSEIMKCCWSMVMSLAHISYNFQDYKMLVSGHESGSSKQCYSRCPELRPSPDPCSVSFKYYKYHHTCAVKKCFFACCKSSNCCLWCISRFCSLRRYNLDDAACRADSLLACRPDSPCTKFHLHPPACNNVS